jgi:hypothetical protein
MPPPIADPLSVRAKLSAAGARISKLSVSVSLTRPHAGPPVT